MAMAVHRRRRSSGVGIADRVGNGQRAAGEGIYFKHSHRTVPENCFSILQGSLNNFTEAGPISRPYQPLGISCTGTIFVSAPAPAGGDDAIDGQIEFHAP